MCGSIGGFNIADPLDISGVQKRKEAGKAADRAARAEAERQARISTNVGAINKAYGGREAQYEDFATALRERFGTELERKNADAARQKTFALARGGLTGGSADIDLGKILSREAQEGTLSAERKAQSEVAGLRGQDEASRLQLISLAQSGSDIGNVASQAANTLRANIEGASARTTSDALGDVFGGSAAIYRKQQEAAARRKGLSEANIYANPFSRGET